MLPFRVVLDRPGAAPVDEYGNPVKPVQMFAPTRAAAAKLRDELLAGQVVGTVARIYETSERLVEESPALPVAPTRQRAY